MQRRGDAVAGVRNAVDVADFVAVVSGNGNFVHAIATFEEFENNLSIKVPVARQLIEWNGAKRADGIGAIPGMEFGEAGADQAVLNERQNFVPKEFVERHMPAPRGAFNHHPRPHNHLGLPSFERRKQVLHNFRRILPVAMKENHDIQPALHGILISAPLVPAVHEIDGVLEDRKMSAREFLLKDFADFEGVVLAGIVKDADFLDLAKNGVGNARENATQS